MQSYIPLEHSHIFHLSLSPPHMHAHTHSDTHEIAFLNEWVFIVLLTAPTSYLESITFCYLLHFLLSWGSSLTCSFLSLQNCGSTYASKYIPIIASVSEHQPPTWPSYFMDINVLAFLVPAGIIVSSWCSIEIFFWVSYPLFTFNFQLIIFIIFLYTTVFLLGLVRHAFCHYLMQAHLWSFT